MGVARIDLMGGDIGVLSRRGQGSTFYFNLPLEAAPLPDEAPTAEAANPACRGWCLDEPARILVADDTADNRLLLGHFLRGEPVELQFAMNGLEAVEACQGQEFDLILMDLDMPEMDGCTAARRIREWQADHGAVPTPIVALSAHAMQEAVRASLDAGCVAHVAKPIERSALLRTINRYALSKRVRPSCPPGSCVVADGVAALVPVYLASKPGQIEAARASLAQRDFEWSQLTYQQQVERPAVALAGQRSDCLGVDQDQAEQEQRNQHDTSRRKGERFVAVQRSVEARRG